MLPSNIANSFNPYNLPTQLSSFIGREHELAEITRLLSKARLITLTGTGGVGKTRLALQIATQELQRFNGEVGLVELGALNEPRMIVPQITRVLNLKETAGLSVLTALTGFLVTKTEVLLVLDCCEHLLQECARVVKILLSACPMLKILATSREPLGVDGEVTLRIPSLRMPSQDGDLTSQDLLSIEASRLFIERAKAANPAFRLSPHNAPAIASICLQLDGIPLALELAAARLRGLGVEQLAALLDRRFQLLASGGDRTALPHQQTLRSLVDWSYNLLVEREKIVFRRLAVFRGGWTLEGASAACGGLYQAQGNWGQLKPEEVMILLLQLVDKSLVQFEQGTPGNADSYRLLETIRQYALEKLEEAEEAEQLSQRHLAYYLELSETAAPLLEGPAGREWARRLERELDNLRTALGWSLQSGQVVTAARLGLALWRFWQIYFHKIEGRDWLEQIVAASDGGDQKLDAKLQAQLYHALGVVCHNLADFKSALDWHERGLDLIRKFDDRSTLTAALLDMGWYNQMQMNLEASGQYAAESLALSREANQPGAIAAALYLQASGRALAGEFDKSLPPLQEAITIWRGLDNRESLTASLSLLAQLEARQNHYETAYRILREVYPADRVEDYRLTTIINFFSLAWTALVAPGQPQGAVLATRLLGAGAAVFARDGFKLPLVEAVESPIHKKLKTWLGEDGFIREWHTGQKLKPLEINTLVKDIIYPEEGKSVQIKESFNSVSTSNSPSLVYLPETFGLSARELEVLRLVAVGLSNSQIAENLTLSPRTVEAHVRSIFLKLDLTSRAAATRFALEHHLS